MVELLSSLAVFSVLALGVATLFTESTQLSYRNFRLNERSEALLEATTTLENILANLVRVRDAKDPSTNTAVLWSGIVNGTSAVPLLCNCGAANGAGPSCVYDTDKPTCGDDLETGLPCPSVPDAVALLEFDAETSTNPSETRPNAGAGDECLRRDEGANNDVINPAVENVIFRGCKKRFLLQFIRPTKNTPVGSDEQRGTPGALELLEIPKDNSAPRIKSRIEGVSRVACGFESNSAGNLAFNYPKPSSFRIDFQVKVANSNTAFGPAGTIESFHPRDAANNPSPAFDRGSHLGYSFVSSLRNINTVGVYFGTTQTVNNCVSVGLAPGGAGLEEKCCSGFVSGGICTAASDCKAQLFSPPATADQCCSKRVLDGSAETCL